MLDYVKNKNKTKFYREILESAFPSTILNRLEVFRGGALGSPHIYCCDRDDCKRRLRSRCGFGS